MKFSLASSVVLVAIVAIGTLEASPSPIRIVTPKPNVDYRIRTVTPNPRIRYLRSIDEKNFTEEPIVDSDLPSSNYYYQTKRKSEEKNIGQENYESAINHEENSEHYELPPRSQQFFLRSSDEDIIEILNPEDKFDHTINKRSPERVVINYKPPPSNGPRHARSTDVKESQELEELEE